ATTSAAAMDFALIPGISYFPCMGVIERKRNYRSRQSEVTCSDGSPADGSRWLRFALGTSALPARSCCRMVAHIRALESIKSRAELRGAVSLAIRESTSAKLPSYD